MWEYVAELAKNEKKFVLVRWARNENDGKRDGKSGWSKRDDAARVDRFKKAAGKQESHLETLQRKYPQ